MEHRGAVLRACIQEQVAEQHACCRRMREADECLWGAAHAQDTEATPDAIAGRRWWYTADVKGDACLNVH